MEKLHVMVWIGLLVAFLIAEASCSLHLVSIWFAAGSFAALIVCWLGGPLWLQVTLFILVSGGLLIGLWPVTKRYLNPSHKATNLDAILGTRCYVISPIDNVHGQGKVKLNGMEWTARSTSGEKIEEGALVTVDRIEGVKVFVSLAEVTV